MKASHLILLAGAVLIGGVGNAQAQLDSGDEGDIFEGMQDPGAQPMPYGSQFAPDPLTLRMHPMRPLDPQIPPAIPYPVAPPIYDPYIRPDQQHSVRDFSWTYIDEPEPQEIKIHDIVTVLVDEKSQVIVDSRFNRQRNGTLKAELKEFVRLSDAGNLIPSALEAPSADSALTTGSRSTGQMANTEGIQYRIAATVVDVYPNGTIALEARKVITTNKERMEYTLTGIIDSRNIQQGNTCRSENIANLVVHKDHGGKIFDATKRPWGMKIYDLISPF